MSMTITHKAVRIIATAFCTASGNTNTPEVPEQSAVRYIVIDNYNTRTGERRIHDLLDPVFLARKAAPTCTI